MGKKVIFEAQTFPVTHYLLCPKHQELSTSPMQAHLCPLQPGESLFKFIILVVILAIPSYN